MLSAILLQMGLKTRYAHISHVTQGDGHLVIEVQEPDTQRWVWLDPDFGAYITDAATGALMGVSDVQKDLMDATKWIVHDVGRKCWIQNAYNPYIPFQGSVAWSRSLMTAQSCADNYAKVMQQYMIHAVFYQQTPKPDNAWRILGDLQIGKSEVPSSAPPPLAETPRLAVKPREADKAAANYARTLAGL